MDLVDDVDRRHRFIGDYFRSNKYSSRSFGDFQKRTAGLLGHKAQGSNEAKARSAIEEFNGG